MDEPSSHLSMQSEKSGGHKFGPEEMEKEHG